MAGRFWGRISILAGVATLVAACGSAPPPAASPAPSQPATSTGPKPALSAGASTAPSAAGQASAAPTWEDTLAAAKREGALVLYGPPGAEIRAALSDGFSAKYPDIKVDYSALGPAELVPKLQTEQAAGKYIADVIVNGTNPITPTLVPAKAVEPVQPYLTGPELKDPTRWQGGKLEFADEAGQFNLVFSTAVSTGGVAINTGTVSPKDIVSWKDLLKFPGKIASGDPRGPGAAGQFALLAYNHPQLGKDFLTKLYSSNVQISKDPLQVVDWVAHGQAAIGIGANEDRVRELNGQGVTTVQTVDAKDITEGGFLTAAWGSLGVASKAPHPNAARVYLNWQLSPDGQLAYTKATGYPSRRTDVSTEFVNPHVVGKPGADYPAQYNERSLKQIPEVWAFLKTVIAA